MAALAVVGLAACGGSSNDNSTSVASTPASTTPAGGGGAAGGGSTVDISTPSGSDLAFDQKSVSAKAGSVTIDFDNKQPLQHDVAVADSSGKILGQTNLVSSGTANATVKPDARHVHLLLHRPGPSRGRDARDADRQVGRARRRAGPVAEFVADAENSRVSDRNSAPPARFAWLLDVYSGRARPTESATQAGLSLPSTSTVKRVTICHQPPPTSSISTTSAVARSLAHDGTGAGKRTLFQP